MNGRARRVVSRRRFLNAAWAAAVGAACLPGCARPQAEAGPEQPAVHVTVRTPTLQMSAPCDPACSASYDFLCRAAEAFMASYAKRPVELEVQEFEIANETAEVADHLGTEGAADVLYEGFFNMATYVHTGYVVPLDDVVSPELEADVDEALWALCRAQGKVYLLPFLAMQNTLCYNAGLLEAAGLQDLIGPADVVACWSWEEWDRALAGLRAWMPPTSYPMLMYAKNDQGDTHVMTLLRSKGCPFFDEDGHVYVSDPRGVEALAWIADSEAKGYFPQGAETLDITDNQDLFITGRLGISMSNTVLDVSEFGGKGLDVRSVNFPTLDGKGCATTFVTGFAVFDNGDADKIEVAKDFLRFLYGSEELLDYQAGSLPCSRSTAERNAEALAPVRRYMDNLDRSVDFTANSPNWRGVRDAFYPHIQDLLLGESPETVAAGIDKDCNRAIDEGRERSVLHE